MMAAPEDIEVELADVPEEILEQMPDELLDQRAAQGAFNNRGRNMDMDLDEDESPDSNPVESRQDFSVRTNDFAENNDEDDHYSGKLKTVVEEAEQVRQELEDFSEESYQSQAEEIPEVPLPYSPFEAEPESFSGVFRLKPKSEQESASADNEDAASAESSDNGYLGQQLGLPLSENEDDTRQPAGLPGIPELRFDKRDED